MYSKAPFLKHRLPDHIDKAIELGAEQIKYFHKDYNPSSSRALGLDPGFGSSQFAMVITEIINGLIVVVYAKAFERPDYQQIIDVAFNLMREYKINRVFVDGSNRAVWTTLHGVTVWLDFQTRSVLT